MNHYQLLDSGDGSKWERFGPHTLMRPCSQAVWRPSSKPPTDAQFNRDEKWAFQKKLPKSWTVVHGGVEFQIAPTDFGHLGLFPEHADLWESMRPLIQKGSRILNLFAYSGGVTLAAAQQGAEVCHLDASKGMVDWARSPGPPLRELSSRGATTVPEGSRGPRRGMTSSRSPLGRAGQWQGDRMEALSPGERIRSARSVVRPTGRAFAKSRRVITTVLRYEPMEA